MTIKSSIYKKEDMNVVYFDQQTDALHAIGTDLGTLALDQHGKGQRTDYPV